MRVGDTLVLRPGDLVPVDGTLLSARAAIDESALTGEPLTRASARATRLLSGSVNRGDAAEMRADRGRAPRASTRKMVELVRRAQEEQPAASSAWPTATPSGSPRSRWRCARSAG